MQPLSLDKPAARTQDPARPAFAHLDAALLTAALARLPTAEVAEFTGSWDRLPADAHLDTARPYRFRRYSGFRIRPGRLELLPHRPFFQDRDINRVYGGVDRLFAPLEERTAGGAVLHTVVHTLLGRLPGPRSGIDTCGVHQIRVVATTDAEGHPAPEGVHQDGHSYVAQVLIGRQDVRGAESTLYDLRRSPLHRALLTEPWETIVLDDRRVLHGVTPVRPAPGAHTGVRDMMLIDFFPGGEGEEGE
ncbi:2OG-Fe dioxygenase family protein [Streptomyces orinoci]|uniref:2OG-Fe dioxygenase family protein n=1 Tax=Streptomyces orinoci TaxID=67339 RepID=A0ABV3JV36_STRON|nr:2OG-Fe dioxygenase family protein [Streptomyces orinoci]